MSASFNSLTLELRVAIISSSLFLEKLAFTSIFLANSTSFSFKAVLYASTFSALAVIVLLVSTSLAFKASISPSIAVSLSLRLAISCVSSASFASKADLYDSTFSVMVFSAVECFSLISAISLSIAVSFSLRPAISLSIAVSLALRLAISLSIAVSFSLRPVISASTSAFLASTAAFKSVYSLSSLLISS